jgi:hypothetical protein
MGKLEVVHGRARDWTSEQVAIVNAGIEATQGTVPHVEGTFDSFLVLDGDRPVGMFTIIPTGNPNAVEVGARFWEQRNSAALVMGRHLWMLFQEFPYVLARCYANNMNVRHLLQRAGFILLGVSRENGRSLHTYGCRRVDFERVAPEGILNG